MKIDKTPSKSADKPGIKRTFGYNLNKNNEFLKL